MTTTKKQNNKNRQLQDDDDDLGYEDSQGDDTEVFIFFFVFDHFQS
jgi:hypothetical protein